MGIWCLCLLGSKVFYRPGLIQQCDFIIQLRTKDSALLPVNLMVQLKSLAVGIGTVASEGSEGPRPRAVQDCCGSISLTYPSSPASTSGGHEVGTAVC